MTEKQREAFRRNVKILMIDKGVTQRQLADAAGCDETFISKILSGAKKPTFDAVVDMADRLGAKIDELIK